jgi:hypothetical protein
LLAAALSGAGVTWKLCVAVITEQSPAPAPEAWSTTVPAPVRVTIFPAIAAGPDCTAMVTGELLPALEVAVTAKGALP